MDERETSAEEQRTSGMHRRRRARQGIAALAVVCAVVGGFGVVALARGSASLTQCMCVGGGAPSAAGQLDSASWQLYHDPLGLFIVRLPPGWKASASLGSYSEGGPDGSDSGQAETINFSNPTVGVTSPRIEVDAQQSHNAALNCGPRSRETSSFNGYPADTSLPAVWLFESENAHFQIDETIPGVLAPINPGGPMNPPTPPPAPPAPTVTAERALLAGMLASFRPTAAPLACG